MIAKAENRLAIEPEMTEALLQCMVRLFSSEAIVVHPPSLRFIVVKKKGEHKEQCTLGAKKLPSATKISLTQASFMFLLSHAKQV